MSQIMVVVGTRPEIIKMAPIVRILEKNSASFTLVHCGQHHDYFMSQKFVFELGLPQPDCSYKVKVSSPGVQTGRIMCFLERTIKDYKPKIVLVEGDTNSVLASAIASLKQGIPVGHVEAGLRSFDLRMPEEHNRRIVDHISSHLFAPTKNACENLKSENVWGKVYVTGNTVIDAVFQYLKVAEEKSEIMSRIRFESFALVTAHRAENVDNPRVLKNLVEAYTEAPIPVIYPVHPRTKKKLIQNSLWKKLKNSKNVQVIHPLGYFDFLILMKNCQFIVTDSGGVQEEATAPPIRKHVIVTRISTERPEAVKAGFAKVVGTDKKRILSAMRKILDKDEKFLPNESPFGNGKASEKIVNIIEKEVLS